MQIFYWLVFHERQTPTSMYLANRGYFVANYALVPHVPFPEQAVLSQMFWLLV